MTPSYLTFAAVLFGICSIGFPILLREYRSLDQASDENADRKGLGTGRANFIHRERY